MAVYCEIISRQISHLVDLPTYVKRIRSARDSISVDPHDLTLSQSNVLAMFYRAICDSHIEDNMVSAQAHLTVLEIVVKTLRWGL